MELSVSQLSKKLGVSPDTVARWFRQGNLPVSKKGANYRFAVKKLQKWAKTNNVRLDLSEKTSPQEKKELSKAPLSSAIIKGGVYFDVQGDDVQSVLESAIEKMDGIDDEHKPQLLEQLLERESALSTGIGRGVAIPHPRQQLNYLDDPLVAVFFLSDPVDYNALDNKEVSILFFILCPELKMHLQLLSAISFCLKDRSFISFLNSQPGKDELIEKIAATEKNNPI